jgi:hypothetical protein
MRLFCLALLLSGCLDKLIPYHAPAHSAPESADLALVADLTQPDSSDLGEAPAPGLSSSHGDLALVPFSLTIEGEAALLTPPMSPSPSPTASGGQYIAVAAGATGGKAVFSFTVPADGAYAVWGRVAAPADTSNSFHVSVDSDVIDDDPSDGLSTIWDLPVNAAWAMVRVNMRIDVNGTDQDRTFMLAAGPHKLYLNQRETLTQLDTLVITNNLQVAPP